MIGLLIGILMLFQSPDSLNYDQAIPVLHDSLLTVDGNVLSLSDLNSWKYSKDLDADTHDESAWILLDKPLSDPKAIPDSLQSETGAYKITFRVDSSFSLKKAYLDFAVRVNIAAEAFLNGSSVLQVGVPAEDKSNEQMVAQYAGYGTVIFLEPGRTYTLRINRSLHDFGAFYSLINQYPRLSPHLIGPRLTRPSLVASEIKDRRLNSMIFGFISAILLLIILLHVILYIKNIDQKENLWLILLTSCIAMVAASPEMFTIHSVWLKFLFTTLNVFGPINALTIIPLTLHFILREQPNRIWKYFAVFGLIFWALSFFQIYQLPSFVTYLLLAISLVGGLSALYKAYKNGRKNILIPAISVLGLPLILAFFVMFNLAGWTPTGWSIVFLRLGTFLTLPVGLSVYQVQKFMKLHKKMDGLVEERTAELNRSLQELKTAQEQLVQQEKLASLGQLTAGIAHEIKNPLNFVNNFSDVSVELIQEAREEVRRLTDDRGPGDDKPLILEILNDIEMNLRKIHEHGSRADGIVKSMLQHSRGGSGTMEPTNVNSLLNEYVNLAFHGMRAGQNPIDVTIEFNLEEDIGTIELIAEDFSRVIVNLCNNAFDAMREKLNSEYRIQNSEFRRI